MLLFLPKIEEMKEALLYVKLDLILQRGGSPWIADEKGPVFSENNPGQGGGGEWPPLQTLLPSDLQEDRGRHLGVRD